MTSPNLPPLKGEASLNVAPWRQGIQQIQSDLRTTADLAKKLGTIKITADLSAGRDVQQAAGKIKAALEEAVPTDMQRRISTLFGGFDVGVGSAATAAAAFEARAAALRARIDELGRGVAITRAQFQAGFGEATPEEITELTERMRAFQRELSEVGDIAKREFGEYSREAQKIANANRLAETSAAAARGEITRLGLASQVKLGTSAALQQYGPQAMGAANGLFQFAQASDTARIAQGLFQKSVQKTGGTSEEAARVVAKLSDTLGVSGDAARDGIRSLLRQGYTLQQAYTALEGAGASALAAGRSAADGMQGYVDAVVSGTSAALASIGISENLFPFYAQYAKSIGKTTDELTRQDKVQAELLLVAAATKDEVADLTALQSGLGGAVNSTNRELSEAQKQLGESLVPIAVNGARALTRVLDVFNAMPPAIQGTTTLLLASAVAVGVLYAPVASLSVGLKGAWESLMRFGPASKGVDAAAAALGRLNVAAKISAAGGFLPWVKSAPAALSALTASTLAASGAQNVMSVAFLKTAGSTTILSGALGTLTLASAAALAGVGALVVGLGVLWANQVKGTTAIYEQVDEANQKAFEQTMDRVRQLMKGGTELGRAQAKVLLLQQSLADAEQGTLKGTNFFTGERIYERDEEAIKRLREQLVGARQNVTQLYTEAQRRGQLNVVLTDEQTEAVRKLREALEGKAFELKLEGMTDLQADLARLGKDFETLRREFKKPFVVNGKLMDPSQTPALRDGLAGLDAQQQAQAAALRKKYADDAVKTARESALAVQQAELDAMREGATKRQAQRDAEVAQIRRETAEKARALADFPAQAQQIEADARRLINTKRRGWAQEDLQLARENAARVQQAQTSARDAEIAGMVDGYAKQEAVRRAALEDLRRDVAERVRLETDPGARAEVQRSGNREIVALERQQQRERETAVREAGQRIVEAQRSARDATLAAMEEGATKEEALRQAELDDLRADIAERVRLEEGRPDVQAAIRQSGQEEVAAKIREQAQQRADAYREGERAVQDAQRAARDAAIGAMEEGYLKEVSVRQAALDDLRETLAREIDEFQGTEEQRVALIQSANRQILSEYARYQRELRKVQEESQRTVGEAQRSARSAEIAAIRDDRARTLASRREELKDFRRQVQEKLDAFQGSEAQRQQVLDAGRREERAKRQQWANEDADLARETARRIAEAWQEVNNKQFAAQQAARDAALAGYNLGVSRRLGAVSGVGDDPLARARIEQEAAARRAQFAQQAADKQLAQDRKNLENARDLALSADNLTANERRIIWSNYYADLDKLASDYQAGNRQRLQQQEDDERQAAENLRQARVDAANRPVQQSEGRVQELERARAIARTDAEVLQLGRQISTERERQITALQGQLDGLNGVVLTTEQREEVEGRIRGLQHDQTVSLREQEEAARGLVDAALSRLDAEAQFAERMARTEAQRLQAQRQQLGVLQASLRNLDDRIATEGKEEQRNALIEQRFGLLGRIADLQDRIDAAPLDAERRRLDLYKAQAQAELTLQGLGDDRAAQAALTVQIAARELQLANARVAAARTEVELQAALTEQAGARAALAQALQGQQQAGREAAAEGMQKTVEAMQDQADAARRVQEALQRQLDLENALLDAAEARARALLQIRGMGDDAVASAEGELRATRDRLALVQQQLAAGGLNAEGRAELMREQVELLGQQAEGERKVLEAQRARRDLLESLTAAEAELTREAQGGSGRLGEEAQATAALAGARQTLATAERAYAEARRDYDLSPSTENAERLLGATKSLTSAIQEHRKATVALLEVQLELQRAQETLGDAARRLDDALPGDRISAEVKASRELAQARLDLSRAEREYALARAMHEAIPTIENAGKLETATDALTGAITAQREAVRGLAEAQRQQISEMDGVREAGERLKAVAYGEPGQPFDTSRELQRLQAIEERRDAAIRATQEALGSGEAARIQQASEQLAREQERYKKQADVLDENGLSGVFSRTGERTVQDLADQIDALGIQYDAEAATLEARAQLIEREADNAHVLQTAAGQFDETTNKIIEALTRPYDLPTNVYAAPEERQGRANSEAQLEGAVRDLTVAIRDVKLEGDREALRDAVAQGLQKGAATLREAKPTPLTAEELDRLAASVGEGAQAGVLQGLQGGTVPNDPARPLTSQDQQWLRENGALVGRIDELIAQLRQKPEAPTPAPKTTPAAQSVVYHIDIGDTVIHAVNAADARRQFDGLWEDKMRDLKRSKAWEPKRC